MQPRPGPDSPENRSGPLTDPTGWPLLVQSGAQTLFYDHRGATVLPAALNAPAGRAAILERFESDLAAGRGGDPRDLLWSPPPGANLDFLSMVGQVAAERGGIRLHAYVGNDLALESFGSAGEGDWAPRFPILRLSQIPAGPGAFGGRRAGDVLTPAEPESAGASASEDGRNENRQPILIYDNPLGAELPAARAEAKYALELFGKERTRFIARPLREDEWRGAFEAARIVLYFGHGKNISGLPAIPGPEDWMPFLPPAVGGGRRLLFNACLDDGAGGLRTPGHFCIYPICRIADRRVDFMNRLLAEWSVSGDPCRALVLAARADEAAGDMRRFIFRMQGGIHQASALPTR